MTGELTLEREAEQLLEETRKGKKPAVQILRDFMTLATGLAAFYQPRPEGMEPNPNYDEARFRHYSQFAVDCAKAIASYETPQLRAIAVAAPAPQREQIKRFKLRIFDHGRDLTALSTEELVRYYRARVAEGPGSAPASLERDAGDKSPVHGEQVIPSLQSPAAAAENTPEPQPEPAARSQPAEAPIKAPVSEPAASVAPPAPVAQLAAPPNVFRVPEAPKAVQEYADSIASAVGPDGRPRAVNAKAISQAALSRAAMPGTRSAGMPRRSGVFDREK
jgi:hypothetical protein